MRYLLLLSLVVAPLSLRARPAQAEPLSSAGLRRIVFSASEYNAYEDIRQRRNNALIAIGGTTLLGSLLAAGITLLAVGLSDSGSVALTTSGVSTLCVAALGAFTALELYQW